MTDENKPSRPGEAALQNMKLLKDESSVFKIPKVPQRKKKFKKVEVLNEDVYTESIAKIIQRDFFPDLEKLNAQNEFLEATENKDYARLRELTRKYSGNRPPTEPYNSPATFDTPNVDRPYTPCTPTVREQSVKSVQIVKEKSRDITDSHTLDSFLSNHTSEDNDSYDRVIALENKKKATKLASQFDAEVSSAALADEALALPSIECQADQTDKPNELATWRYKARNFIMYVPEGSSTQQVAAKPQLEHHNTRLAADPFDHVKNKETIHAIAKTHESSVSGKIGVDGVSITSEKGEGAGPYGYVAAPSPAPGAGADRSPLMTWGEIEGTPFRLDGGDTPLPAAGAGAAYRMLEGGARERLALRLAERAARRRRLTSPAAHRASASPASPAFRTNTERLASMSPAARKLAAKHLMSPRMKLTPHDMGVLSHATPKCTPPSRRPLVATPNVNKKAATPSNAGSVNTSSNMTENNNLTDNLLQINVAKRARLKAQDFFK